MEKSGNSVTTHTRLFKSSRKKPKSQNVSPKPPSKGFLFKEDLLDIQRKLNEEMKLSALKAIQPDELIDVPKPSGGKECKKQIVSEVKSIQTNPQCIKSMDNLDFSRVYNCLLYTSPSPRDS
eukprot:TRINITY_DN13291_c0_g2_i1.p1 TRINITY_DN13291_c0_g2~~TRINITY_DN13291_c0_g2_i1.p1  ORF type:complete len:122 (+),score=17.69 TRINITY_DN13291_c0_g2_i1:132-497(+)